jgi:hypothetical protein
MGRRSEGPIRIAWPMGHISHWKGSQRLKKEKKTVKKEENGHINGGGWRLNFRDSINLEENGVPRSVSMHTYFTYWEGSNI